MDHHHGQPGDCDSSEQAEGGKGGEGGGEEVGREGRGEGMWHLPYIGF